MTLTLRELDDVIAELAGLLAARGPVGVERGAAALYRPRYNAAPGQLHPIVRGAGPTVEMAVWGLAPRGVGRPFSINVRGETAPFRPAFRQAFADRRCLVLADGFYEWREGPGGREPLWFHRQDGGLLLLAGLFDDDGTRPEGAPRLRFGILTTGPNGLMRGVHDRMPALLDAGEAALWLAAPNQNLLHPAAEDLLVATPVSTRVNSVKHDDAACLAPWAPQSQLTLF